MILYFTGTGNSRFAAEYLASSLGDRAEDVFASLRAGDMPTYTSEKPWVIVCPTYAWRIPTVLRDYLLGCDFAGSRDVYFVMTCGGSIGNADKYNRQLASRLGLTHRGTAKLVMPENYIAMFRAPEPEEAAELCRRALPELDRIADTVRSLGDLGFPASLAGAIQSGVVNPAFYRFFVRDSDFAVSADCTGCSLCAKSCPMANITLRDGRPVWGGDCTHCMACITLCPAKAVEYGKKSVGQPRYRCPALSEILK